MTVLIVDDSVTARDLKKRVLANAGFRVNATSMAAALDYLDENGVGLVVLDIKPPDMRGFDLSREIKKRHPGVLVLQTSPTFTTPGRGWRRWKRAPTPISWSRWRSANSWPPPAP